MSVEVMTGLTPGKVTMSPVTSVRRRSVAVDQQAAPPDQKGVFTVLDVPASMAFGKVMQDIQTKRQDQIRRLQEQLEAARLEGQQQDQVDISIQLEDLIDEEEEDETDAEALAQKLEMDKMEKSRRQAAHRAWGRLRGHVHTMMVERANQKSTVQWSILKQTLKNMSNMDRAREQLYERYLTPRVAPGWTEGLSYCPEHIFKKGRRGMRVSSDSEITKAGGASPIKGTNGKTPRKTKKDEVDSVTKKSYRKST